MRPWKVRLGMGGGASCRRFGGFFLSRCCCLGASTCEACCSCCCCWDAADCLSALAPLSDFESRLESRLSAESATDAIWVVSVSVLSCLFSPPLPKSKSFVDLTKLEARSRLKKLWGGQQEEGAKISVTIAMLAIYISRPTQTFS
jgi:hypothetical protein